MRYLFILFGFLVINAYAQERIDATIDFQTDPAKQYSIYIPSSYDENTPNKMMLGLHPWNTSRWNSISWCDTLIHFAEMNDLLLICPDGGADGQIDDPIDTAFTSLLLDSMLHWYNVDISQVYAMGFSWGGKTTYTYGLNHAQRFAGLMPIGAATSVSDLNGIVQHANEKPFYIIHGNNDSPNTRFYPMRDAVESAGACVETNLLSGVGHTIDFADRDAILTEGFQWIMEQNCAISTINEISKNTVTLFPNPIARTQTIQFNGLVTENHLIQIFDSKGKLYFEGIQQAIPPMTKTGVYLIFIKQKDTFSYQKIIVQ